MSFKLEHKISVLKRYGAFLPQSKEWLDCFVADYTQVASIRCEQLQRIRVMEMMFPLWAATINSCFCCSDLKQEKISNGMQLNIEGLLSICSTTGE